MHFVLAWLVIACFVLVASNSRSYYRPQRSCEGYVFTRVCNSVHGGGVAIPACIAGGIPACLAAGLQGRGGGVACSGRYLLRAGVWRPPRRQTATVADGTYPTGMHSCYWFYLITGRNKVVAKVMFLFVSVILSTGGGCLPQCMHPWEQTPPQEQTPPGADTPSEQTPPPPGSRHPPESRLQHTVNERPVRILLECILVNYNKGAGRLYAELLSLADDICHPHVIRMSSAHPKLAWGA